MHSMDYDDGILRRVRQPVAVPSCIFDDRALFHMQCGWTCRPPSRTGSGKVKAVFICSQCEDEADAACLAERVYERGVHDSLIWCLVCNLCWAIWLHILRIYYAALALVLQMNFLEDRPFEGFQLTTPMSTGAPMSITAPLTHPDTASTTYPLKNLHSPSNLGSKTPSGGRFLM